ncbi:hypothetical protein Cfor_10220 [Coptotermes formosanus]|uniref:Uncharacterized protein n=1 Tax=Coptotermes formosanus TaxID=36987 RepID=A0A6L2Q5Y5_COPFO|nr:hypothetical protein Cfor_10220 [Coptotermes formosanus]
MELALFRAPQQEQECGGAVLHNSPAEETVTSATATMTSCPQQQNLVLDDGYGSSNSSPHSSGTVQICGLSLMCMRLSWAA